MTTLVHPPARARPEHPWKSWADQQTPPAQNQHPTRSDPKTDQKIIAEMHRWIEA
jgi:hypothetical protein